MYTYMYTLSFMFAPALFPYRNYQYGGLWRFRKGSSKKNIHIFIFMIYFRHMIFFRTESIDTVDLAVPYYICMYIFFGRVIFFSLTGISDTVDYAIVLFYICICIYMIFLWRLIFFLFLTGIIAVLLYICMYIYMMFFFGA